MPPDPKNIEHSKSIASRDAVSVNGVGILDTIDVPLIVVEQDCKITSFNRAAAETFGLQTSDVGGLPSDTQMLAELKEFEKECLQVMAEGVPRRREIKYSDRWFALRIAPYLGGDGQKIGAVLTFTNVTAFRESVERAIYEREHAKGILNTVTGALIVLDSELRVQSANRAFYSLFEVSREAAHSIPLCDLGDNDWKTSNLWTALKSLLSNQQEFRTMEIERVFATGRRTVLLDARRLFQDDKTRNLLLLAFHDITERRKAEEALRESEARMAGEANALGRLNDASSRLWQMPELQAGLDEMLSATIAMLGADMGNIQLYDAERGELRIAVHRGFKQDFLDFFSTVTTKDNSACGRTLRAGQRTIIEDVELDEAYAPLRPVAQAAGYRAVQSTPLIGRDGRPLGMLSTHWRQPHRANEQELRRLDLYVGQAADFIERKRAQEALRESEERFRAVADNITQLAWICERLGEVTWYNQRWLDYTGLTLEDMKGWGWKHCQHPDHVDNVVASVEHSRDTGTPWEHTFPLRGKDGNFRWFLSRAVPIRNASGEITRWFGTNTDVTELRDADEIVRKTRDRAEAASLAKDDFLAALSHELRTPLNPILAIASENATDEAYSPEVRAAFDTIRKNVELEARLIDDLLDVTKISKGKMSFQPTEIDPVETLHEAIENIRSDSSAKEIKIQLNLSNEKIAVFIDPARLQQVFWNVLKNAIKFTPEKGNISIISKLTATGIIFEFIDTGIGMSPAEIERVFDAFSQGDHATNSDRHRFGGLGLGLAISKTILESQGGKISVTSLGQGQGCTFSVELPRYAGSAKIFDGTKDSANLEIARVPNLRILLVEDHESTRKALEQLLTKRGHKVTVAENATKAIAAGERDEYDLLLCDIGLPDKNGYEVARAFRKKHPQVISIALTGYGMDEDLEKAKVAGFNEQLTKPVSVSVIDASIRRLFKT